MSFLSKVELKKQLQALGIKVEGNYVRKKDIERVVGAKELTTNEIKKIYKDYFELKNDSNEGVPEWKGFKLKTPELQEMMECHEPISENGYTYEDVKKALKSAGLPFSEKDEVYVDSKGVEYITKNGNPIKKKTT